jgi:hypothetical protein
MVQLYFQRPRISTSQLMPLNELKGFAKVGTCSGPITTDIDAIGKYSWDESADTWRAQNGTYVVLARASVADINDWMALTVVVDFT